MTVVATRHPVTDIVPPVLANTAPRRSQTRWTNEDIAAHPARYLQWLRKINTEYWLAINHPHSEADFDTAINVCRAYKARYGEYTSTGSPAFMRPELRRLADTMRATLARLGFRNPVDVWEKYQHWQARDHYGRHPDHTREIEALEYTLWQREISNTPAMDVYADVIYNNVDQALERPRQHRTTYAPTDDVESPAARLAYLETRIANLKAHRNSITARIWQADRQTTRQLKRLYKRVTSDLQSAQAEHAELDELLHPQKYGIVRDPADQRELVALATPDYGLRTTPPIPDDGCWQAIDLDDRLAATLDSIRHLLSLHTRNQDVIFEMETYPQAKRTLGHIASLTARYELQDAITHSIGQHHSQRITRYAPAPPLPIADTADDLF